MNVSIVYSSLSGCTKKTAKGLHAKLKQTHDVSLHTVEDITPDELPKDLDLLVFGYWVDRGGLNEQAKAWLQAVHGKKMYLFCTLAYYADSPHAETAIRDAVDLAKKGKNDVLGYYAAQGSMSPAMIKRFKQMAKTAEETADESNPHVYTKEKGIRYDVFKDHPTPCEIALMAERIQERLEILERKQKLK